jgi:hypothetical protein
MAQFLLIVPTTHDIALYGAERFYTDGAKCWALNGRGLRGEVIPWPTWHPMRPTEYHDRLPQS